MTNLKQLANELQDLVNEAEETRKYVNTIHNDVSLKLFKMSNQLKELLSDLKENK